jgi:plasmid stability protein
MARSIQLRNVPDELHRVLKARAALAGLSLSEYLIQEVQQLAQRPTKDEMRERLNRRSPVALEPPSADLVREERDRR